MGWHFEDFELDAGAFELRQAGKPLAIEPKAISLLLLLIENKDRLLGKEEIIDVIWDGRAISDSSLSTAIKTLRQALGDDGKQQRLIKTVHGKGFRFVGDAVERNPTSTTMIVPASEALDSPTEPRRTQNELQARPSIAVLPFRLVGVAGPLAHMAEAVPYELITEMARLRWLFVIARGSSFRFSSARFDLAEIRAKLGVRYCLSGSIEISGRAMVVSVELADTRDSGILWAERFEESVDAVHEIRSRIITAIISALEMQIPLNEARRAKLTSPQHLDAWGFYHLGVEQMFQFTAKGNENAIGLFEKAIGLEPSFARAHAGLSFAHYQDAFLGHAIDRNQSVNAALRSADLALDNDALDPFVNLVKGRSLWLERNLEGSEVWLDRTVHLSPSYAHGQYSKSWAEVVLMKTEAASANVDLAMRLSPLDPMMSSMCGIRAGACGIQGDYAEAARWAEKGATAPGSHGVLLALAAAYYQMSGNTDRATIWAMKAKQNIPGLSREMLFESLPFSDQNWISRIGAAFDEVGF